MGGNWSASSTYGICDWANNATTATLCSNDWLDAAGITASAVKSIYKKYSMNYPVADIIERIPDKLPAGKRTMELPDGAKLIVDDAGNYRIEDQNAKVTYKANRLREFSPYMNASDLLAQFVSYVGTLGVKRAEVLGLPLHLFVSWLIIEAALKDGDEIPSDVVPVGQDPLVRLAIKPKCLRCGRYIRRLHYRNRFPFCSPEHGADYTRRIESQNGLIVAG